VESGVTDDYERLNKPELHAMADLLLIEDPEAIAWCVRFVAADTRGWWHNRARAMMCRRMKHCPLDDKQRSILVACIVERLQSGIFDEQFRDQLRFALKVDRQRVISAAHEILTGKSAAKQKEHVYRFALWTLRNHG